MIIRLSANPSFRWTVYKDVEVSALPTLETVVSIDDMEFDVEEILLLVGEKPDYQVNFGDLEGVEVEYMLKRGWTLNKDTPYNPEVI